MTSALKIKESGSSGRRYTADGVQITSRQSVYDQDEIGNRVTSSTPGYVPYTVNDDNQYTVMKDVSLTYDPAGNLLTNGSWTYSWDNENRLTQVVSTSKLIQFTYDTQGRRIEKKVWNNTTGTGTPTTYLKYIYDGWNLIAELNGNSSNAKVRTYTWGLDISGSTTEAGGVGGLLMVDDASNGVHFVSYDLNGNVMGVVKAADGTVSAAYEYGPFGELLSSTGSMSPSNPFRFSTKYRDNETDLYYYGYRYYSPSLGRWISRDPIEEQGGLNLYNFVNNDPVNHWDLWGKEIPSFDSVDANPSIIIDLIKDELGITLKEFQKKLYTCVSIYKLYKSFKCSGCSKGKLCFTREEAAIRAACLSSEIALRERYVLLKCDYVLLGSVRAGSKRKEINHRIEIANKSRALMKCLEKAAL